MTRREHIGEWHRITAWSAADSFSGGLDFDIEHPDSCPKLEHTEKGHYLSWVDYVCDMGVTIANNGVAGFLTEPGEYRARCHLWSIGLPPHIGTEEWDEAVEVEAVSVDA